MAIEVTAMNWALVARVFTRWRSLDEAVARSEVRLVSNLAWSPLLRAKRRRAGLSRDLET